LLFPGGDAWAAAVASLGLLGTALACRLARPTAAIERLQQGASAKWAMAVIALSAATAIPLAAIELAARGLTNWNVLKHHLPIETVWKAGADDWRTATITADEYRDPDPVLLWHPVSRKPYNSQRMKGPLLTTPKRDGVIRVMCYGDSLTDGPPRGDWPSRLHSMLQRPTSPTGLHFEVVNAGVAGYSSLQGLSRFLQQVDRYQPDLVLVSYGWNDVAQAVGPADRDFRPPAWPVVSLQRALIRYRAYRVLTYYVRKLRPEPAARPAIPYHPRVSAEEYLANLDRFRSEAEARNISMVFLTRPHQMPPSLLRRTETWRRHVPEYNAALIEWARRKRLALIDVQQFFEDQPTSLFSDECHFVPAGYELMSELVRERLFEGPQRLIRIEGQPPRVARVNEAGPGPI
jgi:lysophospholipase L1-like esterase